VFLTNPIKLILLCILQFSLTSHAMFSNDFKKKEIVFGKITIDGQTHEYYALINNKEKNYIHITNRTNRPLIIRSAGGKTIIKKSATESAMLDENYINKLAYGQKVSLLIMITKTEKLIGSIDADIFLLGGNFTIMRRLAAKDEL
jgi:hypothetical protein